MIKKLHRFDKWSEFMENAIHGNHNMILRDNECQSRMDEWAETNPWSGCHSFDEALEWLKDGWQDGLDRLKMFQKGIPPDLFDCVMPVKEFKPELQHLVAGGSVDIAAHLTGATPNVFLGEVIPIEQGQQVVKGRKLQTVYVNIGNLSTYTSASYFARGAYTYALIDHMENCGYSCEVWCVQASLCRDNHDLASFIYVKVKEFGELMDPNKTAIALCSAFMMRRFIFSIKEQGDDEMIREIVCKGYGRSFSPSLESVTLPEDKAIHPLYIDIVNEEDPSVILSKFRHSLQVHIEQEFEANPDGNTDPGASNNPTPNLGN